MKFIRKYQVYIFIGILIISAILLAYFIYIRDFSHRYLKVVFFDVGQGDAIYIEAPNKKQVLIDGGPDDSVLPLLSRFMPFGDRSIDLVVATHPDADHISGLARVLDNYKVQSVIDNGIVNDTTIYNNLENEIKENNTNKIIGRAGEKILLDSKRNIYMQILAPFDDMSKEDTNDNSVVVKLVYGEASFIFTGDATIYSEVLMHQRERDLLDVDVLKLGHHGSKSSSSVLFLEDTTPDVGIILAGKNNRYGHPDKEVLDRLSRLKISHLSTIDEGNIIFKTDGVKIFK